MSRRPPRGLCVHAVALSLFALLASLELQAQDSLRFTGQADGSVSGALGYDYGSGPELSFGAETYANLRLRARAAEGASVFAALNLLAASGAALPASLVAAPAPAGGFVVGSGYAGALELERLYLRLEADAFDTELGLLRLASGFGQAWSPSDFLSERNPLHAEARPRGVLGFTVSAYPADEARLRLFGAAGSDPLQTSGEGAVLGLSAEAHGERASVQALYAFQAPGGAYALGLHRAGLSLKLEALVSLVLDALYTLDPDTLGEAEWYGRTRTGLEGLEAAIGMDYSFADGKLLGIAQYLYHGSGYLRAGDALDLLYDDTTWSSMAPGADRKPEEEVPFAELNRRHYLFASLTWLASDYASATLSWVASLADLSAVPSLVWSHELSQALSLRLEASAALDRRSLSSALPPGELGPLHTGSVGALSARLRLRF